MSFEDFLARREAERAAAPPRVTWRKVAVMTGGGWSGLGPHGQLVFVLEQQASEGFGYGRTIGKSRDPIGHAPTLAGAKRLAEALVSKEAAVGS